MEPGDIILIHQLLGLYGHIVDAAEWDRFDELFVTDAELDYTAVRAPHVCHGIAEIRAYFDGANHPSAHHVSNIVVFERDGEVHVRSKFFVPFTRATHDPLRWYGGDYDDIVVATPDGWRFASRTCTGRWQLTASDDDVAVHRRTF